MTKNKLNPGKIVGMFIFLLVACGSGVCSDYPWEQEESKEPTVQTHKPDASKQKPDASVQKVYARFGPFIAEKQNNWGISEDEDLGECLALVNGWGIPQAVIARAEIQETKDRKLFEEIIQNSITHNQASRMQLCNNDTLVLRDLSDGETLFYLFPYKGDTVYPLYVLYDSEKENITDEVRQMLSTFQFAD